VDNEEVMPMPRASALARTPRDLSPERQQWYNSYTVPLEFAFDPEKSTGNKAKHGIDFIEAQEIWTDVDRLEVPARSLDEARHLVIGRIGETTWSAFITYRNEKIRIISVRHARSDEEAWYRADADQGLERRSSR
jgi:hypothetical protein